jgi:hypothetical protein
MPLRRPLPLLTLPPPLLRPLTLPLLPLTLLRRLPMPLPLRLRPRSSNRLKNDHCFEPSGSMTRPGQYAQRLPGLCLFWRESDSQRP